MAVKLPEFFTKTDTKSRLILVVVSFVVIFGLIFLGSYFLGGSQATVAAKVAGAPSGLQSVPGGQLSPEYSRALQQANAQTARQAQISGGSAVPTLMNVPGQQSFSQDNSNCTVLCPNGDNADVTADVNNLLKQGKISQEEANTLLSMAKNNVPVDQYAAELNELVRQGKITPEEARKLLEVYKKQHANALVAESGQAMDALIKSGKLPLDAANQLLELQKQGATPEQYAAALNELVREGKITPEVAAQLMAQYTQQQAQEKAKAGITQLQQMVKSGELSADVANDLIALQKKNVPVSEYAAELSRLVSEGKITPAMAAKLLQQYQSQAATNGQTMDALIKSGKLPIDAAAHLLELQKKGATTAEYADALNELVRQGKITPEVAAQLLAQYTQQQAQQMAREGADQIQAMVKSGEISQAVADDLLALQKKNVPVSQYAAELAKLVAEGKLTPAAAAKLLEQYQHQRTGTAPGEDVKVLLEAAKAKCTTEMNSLTTQGKLSQDVASTLFDLRNKGVSEKEYGAAITQAVTAKKLDPAVARSLMDCYHKLSAIQAMAKKLLEMQGNNASAAEYAEQLKHMVADGTLSPEEATRLLQEYQAAVTPVSAGGAGSIAIIPNVPGANKLASIQNSLQASQAANAGENAAVTTTFTAPTGEAGSGNAEFDAAVAQRAADEEQKHQQHIQDLMNGMSGQAQSLINSWQPTNMQHRAGSYAEGFGGSKSSTAEAGGKGSSTTTTTTTEAGGPPLIKAGTIFFAVLDTAVNSDYPDTPVLATIIAGKYKGAKLLGKLSLAQGQDRVSLNFNLMDMEDWPKTKGVTAFAIDPDTARTVMASSVDYHYLLRYGSIMGTAFLTGYANAITTSASTSTTGIFGTSSTHPNLSPGKEIAVGLGQVGTTLGSAMSNYFNTPNTVRVNAGVGIGILFMSDVTG